MTFARRARVLEQSATQRINDRALELKREGRDLVDLGAGDPRFSEPESAKEAGIRAIEDEITGYTEAGGVPKLREAIVKRYEKAFGLEVEELTSIATVGAKTALYEIAQLFYEEGDEVIIPRPYWVSYPAQVKLAGATPVYAEGKRENNYIPTAAEIEKEISPDTVAILLNSPSNPTGGVYDEEQGREILDLARAEDLLLISDECYDGFVYERDRFWTLASEGYEKGLVVGSTSKNFGMTGWRLGYVLGRENYIRELVKLQSQLTSSPPTVSQMAAEAVIKDQVSLSRELREKFTRRRDFLVEGLAKLPGVDCPAPPGSFYLFPEITEVLERLGYGRGEDERFAGYLLEEAGVVTVPGTAFGTPGHLRLAYLPELSRLGEALDRIKSAVNDL